MSSVVDAMIEPMLLVPPFFDIPPFTEVICSAVELIKGGQIEEIPGIGLIIKYGRESILVLVLLIVLYIKVWQYIGPKIWRFAENRKFRDPPEPVFNEEDCTGYCGVTDYGSYAVKFVLWAPFGFINWLITTFIQIPVDIMSWDMESLSIDFDNEWGGPKNIFRDDCRRFINGSYAGDYSLYEDETNDTYVGDTHSRTFDDEYKHSPEKYLCTHGNNCEEMADIFGRTMMGKNEPFTDKEGNIIEAPTSGNINGINITSAPRKYSACCKNVATSPGTKDCESYCHGEYPMPNLGNGNPFRDLSSDDIENIMHNPIGFILEPINAIIDYPEDYNAATCHMQNFLFDKWKSLCSGRFNPLPCPDGVLNLLDKRKEGPLGREDPTGEYNGCSKKISDIISDIGRNIDRSIAKCIENCEYENNLILNTRGCHTSDMEKAKRSVLRNRNDVLLSRLPTDYENNKIKDMAIKRTKWERGERPDGLNPENTEYNRGQQMFTAEALTTDSGTVCSRQDLSESELEECFGPFRPMIAEQYPVLFYKIIKDFMGSVLWFLFVLFIFFVILYILCLFNPIGRAEYEFNKNAGMIEGGIKSMGLNMKDLNLDKMIK